MADLSARGSKAGWLERKKKTSMLGGSAWKKGFWVLQGTSKSLREFASEETAEKQQGATFDLDANKLDSVVKDSTVTLLVSTKDGQKLHLRCASEDECDDWILAFDELASGLLPKGQLPPPVLSEEGHTSDREHSNTSAMTSPRIRDLSSAGAVPPSPSSSGGGSPIAKHGSSRSLLKVASMRLPISPLIAKKSMRQLDTSAGAGTASPGMGSPKKSSFFEKDMIDSQLFMNKARSLAMSISRGTAESSRLKTSASTEAEKGANRSNRALILPSQMPDEVVEAARYIKTLQQQAMLVKVITGELCHVGNMVLVDSAQSVLEAMYSVRLGRNSKLIEQGEPVERCFVLESGTVGVYSHDFVNRPMELEVTKDKAGEAFGVLSIVYNQPGLFTCKTHTDCTMWVLSRQKLHDIATREARKKVAKKINLLERIPIIADNLDKQTIDQLADCMQIEEVAQDKFIVKKGDSLRRVLVIAEGVAEMVQAGGHRTRLKKGEIFGEWALLEASNKNLTSDADLIARSPQVRLLSLAVDEVEDLVGPLRTLVLRKWREHKKHESVEGSDRSLPIQQGSTRDLPVSSNTQQLVEQVIVNPTALNGEATKEEEEEVIRQVAIAIKTRETMIRGKAGAEAATAALQHQQTRLPPGKSRPSEVKQDSSDDDDDDDEEKDDDGDDNLDKPFDKASPLRPELTLDTIKLKAILGKGNFGTVHLAVKGSERFALKVISGEFIVSHGWEYSIESERDAMGEISAMSSPFLLKMYNYFADKRNVYFVLELCEGGSLLHLLAQTGNRRIAEDVARFYLANVVMSLEHLQTHDICYRDLKPENVMITDSGYCKLIDFGLTKKTLRTFTVCGTPEYTAPEVLHRIGHGMAVDWWACGILLYEMVCGTTPFIGSEPMEVYESILAHELPGDIVYPGDAKVTHEAKGLISEFLNPFKNKRIGVRFPGVRGIKAHPFFAKFDWDALERLKMSPPIRPQGASANASDDYNADLTSTPEDKTSWTTKFAAGEKA